MTASEYISIELLRLNGKIEAIKDIPDWNHSTTLKQLMKITSGEYAGILKAKAALAKVESHD